MLMAAQIGKDIVMDTHAPENVTLKHLRNGDTIKGTTKKFTFTMNNCWHCYNASPLINDTTKAPQYPRNKEDDMVGDTDLNTVMLRQLRSKSGPSGMTVTLIVSQSEGVLPSLTEFHYIKTTGDNFGIGGTRDHYFLDLLPEVKLQRTNVRSKIADNVELQRALNITSELCQMTALWHHLPEGFLCTPKELYDDLKAKGYDWSILLATRGWWTLDDAHPLPFLSTYDLLNMRIGTYHPYWYKEKLVTK